MNFAPYYIRRHLGCAALLAGAIALSGCQTTPTSAPSKPRLRILQSEPLKVADNCDASGSYFVEFTVMSDGRTDDIKASAGPACIQEALTAWVSSFRYEAPGQEIPSGVEWLMVTAQKGS
ncbi:hypothetical protein GCM10011487_13540 [Steroidobacter agaridevorans]|uniref:TonB C-terminal domain-containing protein n=1 Tax=Steroidobacter agaridevorans TaxID=2695856 RepID=A0A829Y7V3_9GAMM|nr:hypothetical protein [Steroidobacter agaridevorans]GFE79354.1 hypothetical protein GCM10011487_13540 [Steroidobacter agaridevorans]